MWYRWLGIAGLGFLALHSLSYGGGFVADPGGMAQEFGDNDPASEAAENLTGLVGVIMLLMAALAIAGIVLLVRRHPAGAWITGGLGLATLAIGVYWGVVGRAWDFGIYGGFGFVLGAVGAALLVRAPRS